MVRKTDLIPQWNEVGFLSQPTKKRSNRTWTLHKRRPLSCWSPDSVFAVIPFTCRLRRHFAVFRKTANGGVGYDLLPVPIREAGDCQPLLLVRATGLEPAHLAIQDPKSCASANFAMPAYCMVGWRNFFAHARVLCGGLAKFFRACPHIGRLGNP